MTKSCQRTPKVDGGPPTICNNKHVKTGGLTIWVQLSGKEGRPPKVWQEKGLKFRKTSDFDREYLRNGGRYRKSEKKQVINYGPFHVKRKT